MDSASTPETGKPSPPQLADAKPFEIKLLSFIHSTAQQRNLSSPVFSSGASPLSLIPHLTLLKKKKSKSKRPRALRDPLNTLIRQTLLVPSLKSPLPAFRRFNHNALSSAIFFSDADTHARAENQRFRFLILSLRLRKVDSAGKGSVPRNHAYSCTYY